MVGGGHRRRLICRFKVVWWWPIERRAVSIRFGYRTCFFFVFSFVIESIHGRRIRVDFRASISNGFAKKKTNQNKVPRCLSVCFSDFFFLYFFCRGGEVLFLLLVFFSVVFLAQVRKHIQFQGKWANPAGGRPIGLIFPPFTPAPLPVTPPFYPPGPSIGSANQIHLGRIQCFLSRSRQKGK